MKNDSRLEPTWDSRCGIYAGVIRHGRLKEKPCEPCRIARNEYRNKRKMPRQFPSVTRDKCGTSAGYKAHESRGEFPCRPCMDAINKVVRERNDLPLRAKREREYRANNKEHMSNLGREYRLKYPEKKRAKDNRRAARKKGAIVIEKFEVSDILAKWGTDCHICLEPIDLEAERHPGSEGWERGLHLDHLIPLATGGQHTLENVKPAHGFCNLSKGVKIL
jgi:5-methylcytosine-specific restriction endonuclease McrA